MSLQFDSSNPPKLGQICSFSILFHSKVSNIAAASFQSLRIEKMWQKPSVWDPPTRFQKQPQGLPPAFPAIEEQKEGENVVKAQSLPCQSPLPDAESDDETEIMESFPPLLFQDKANSMISREIEANSGSQQATAVFPSISYYRVPPLLAICPYCGDFQPPVLPFAEPSACRTCKQSLD